MIQTELTVQNQLGLHARVASYIVRQAKTFSSDIYINKNEKKYDLKTQNIRTHSVSYLMARMSRRQVRRSRSCLRKSLERSEQHG